MSRLQDSGLRRVKLPLVTKQRKAAWQAAAAAAGGSALIWIWEAVAKVAKGREIAAWLYKTAILAGLFWLGIVGGISEGSCAELVANRGVICRIDAKFSPVVVSKNVVIFVDNAIPEKASNPGNLAEERRNFYGVFPPFLGFTLSLVGICCVGWAWWNIRFTHRLCGRRLALAVVSMVLGAIACYYGFNSLTVWSLGW